MVDAAASTQNSGPQQHTSMGHNNLGGGEENLFSSLIVNNQSEPNTIYQQGYDMAFNQSAAQMMHNQNQNNRDSNKRVVFGKKPVLHPQT